MASQVIAPTGGNVQCAEDFLILDIATRGRQVLGAKSQFS